MDQQGDWVIFWKQFATFVHFYFRCCAGNADAKLCIYQSRSCSTSHLRLRGKIIFPPWASVLSSIDQRAKWVSGQEGGGGEINFPGFPNLHSAAKKSICLIYREPAGGGEIAPTDQHNVQLRLEGIWCHACNNMGHFFYTNFPRVVKKRPWWSWRPRWSQSQWVGGRWLCRMMLGSGYLTLYKSHNRPPYAAFLSPFQYLTPVLLVVENDISWMLPHPERHVFYLTFSVVHKEIFRAFLTVPPDFQYQNENQRNAFKKISILKSWPRLFVWELKMERNSYKKNHLAEFSQVWAF